MIGDFLEKYTFDYLMNDALSRVNENIDTREGSIIYDALAPACYELAGFYLQLKNLLLDTFPQTAIGQYLDYKVEEFGLHRYPSKKAVRFAEFKNERKEGVQIALGSRFATIDDAALIYKVVRATSVAGKYEVECETTGVVGNRYYGNILPLENYRNLATAVLGEIVTSGQDEETDDELRKRFLIYVNEKPFGGNFIEYVQRVREIDGVGAVQVYPVWNGSGTVKVVVLDNDLNLASAETIKKVQNVLDPLEYTGKGVGLAPINHRVTVTTATRFPIDIEFKLELMTGYQLNQVKELVDKALDQYFLDLRKNWAQYSDVNTYSMKIYRSQLMAKLLTITGIANVDKMKLNNREADLSLVFTGQLQQLPYKGTVRMV